MVVRCSFALALLVACGGKYGGTPPGTTTPKQAPMGKRGIEAAALPYSILDARTGHEVDKATFWAKVDASRLVCVGEDHSNPHHHWVQLEVMNEVVAHKKHTLALGMEMFQGRSRACSTTTQRRASTKQRCSRAPIGRIAGASTTAFTD